MKRPSPLLPPTVLLFCLLGVSIVSAQVPDSPFGSSAPPGQAAPAAPAPAAPAPAAPASSAPARTDNNFLGKDAPEFDPGSEVMTWDGKHWNVNNNRLFGARFEKYLNAEAETTATDTQYRQVVQTILTRLSPYQISPASLDEAFRLLPRASSFEEDANLSDALASSVYSVWQARREDARLVQANASLEDERRKVQWNAQMSSGSLGTDTPPGARASKAEQDQWQKDESTRRDMTMTPYLARLAEIKLETTANKAKRELSEVQTKLEFQALIVQFFLQRRFQHVLMATQFYRAIFGEGDTSLKLGGDAKKMFDTTTGMPPTVSVLDSLAREAMRDAREGVEAYKFLLSKNELESATKRLGEAFAVGEYLPELRTLPRDDKRQALAFTQKSNQLISALEVKDYTLAAKLVTGLEETAKDFDNSKPMAAIETAKTVAAMHLAKARNAAVSNDRVTLESRTQGSHRNLAAQPGVERTERGDFFAKRRAGQGADGFRPTAQPAQLPADLRRPDALHRRRGDVARTPGATQDRAHEHADH